MAGTDVAEISVRGNRAQGAEAGSWPDWPLDQEEVGQLARYVSVAHAARSMPTDLRGGLPPDARDDQRLARAEQIYRSLAARRIPYASAPWNPATYDRHGRPAWQRIRTPQETIEGPATCLDLMLTFTAMAIEAGLRPLIAIRYGISPHALVVVDYAWDAVSLAEYDSLPGFRPRPGQTGIWDTEEPTDEALSTLAGVPGFLPIDVVRVTRPELGFGKVSGRTMARGQDQAGATWTLIDVRRVLAELGREGLGPFDPPLGRSAPPIHGYLPAVPEFRDFASRRGFLRELERRVHGGPAATVVIAAPSGYGKSMLAHRLAVGADNGCGWFLNATDAKELRRSLAQAERGEHELAGERPQPGGEKADAVDDQAFAAAALDRLRGTDRPWVVVVDNCDSPPDAPGLADLLPQPHAPGQVVIITTTQPDWLGYASDSSNRIELAGLGPGDLRDLELPSGLADPVAGRPLIGLALAALRDHGAVDLPAKSELDGPQLVWELLLSSPVAGAGVVELARLLAWLPPEPMREQALAMIAPLDASPGDTLERLRLVTRTTATEAQLEADGDAGDRGVRYRELSAGGETGDSPGLLMHRLFAAAVREQAWRDEPGAAADAVARLLTTGPGRWLFITAADDKALGRLERGAGPGEPGEVSRAVDRLGKHPRPGALAPGLLWHGLGHVRERRGPVKDSRNPFEAAMATLDPDSHPYEVAESQIGVARVTYQNGRSTDTELRAARDQAEQARELLASARDTDSRQLREQANALSWLIEQKLTAREPDLDRQEARYDEVYRNLWLSFAERLRIRRSLDPGTPIGPDAAPQLDDGLGPERAYFNLAGAAIQLAKTHHRLARRAAATAGRPLTANDKLLRRIAEDLDNAERVYQVVRGLRELRYGGRPHPHLAACLNGLAIVGHYRAALLDQVGELAAAAGHGAAAFDQRLRIAGSLTGPDARAALRDGDVRKSADLLLKIVTDVILTRYSDPQEGADAVAKVIGEAAGEWQSGPARGEGNGVEQRRQETVVVRGPGDDSPEGNGLILAPPVAPPPRYLSASYPDVVRPRQRFSLEASVTLNPGPGISEAAIIHGLVVPPAGKPLLLSVYAPDLIVHGEHQQELLVPAGADSVPVRFELEGTRAGVRRIRLRAWDGGTCVGEVHAEVTVDEYARGGGDMWAESELDAEPLSGEVTLEVTHHAVNGHNRYGFRFRDADVRYPEEFRPLRYDPAIDAEALVQRINAILRSGPDMSRYQMYRALSQEGAELWDDIVPDAVQRQFWGCVDRIKHLTILSDNDAFPWELLYPGDRGVEFLVTADFPVVRRVDDWRWSRQLHKRPARFVVPREPADVPPLAEREATLLREALQASEPNITTLRELQDLIDGGGFGILHFACHAGFSRDDLGPKIVLDQPFLPRELGRRRRTWQQPLVFLNACRSAGPRNRCFGLDGFAQKFLLAGAGAFIGSLWEVSDRTALRFATELYQMMQDGKTLGEAVTALRGKVEKGDPTWLAYAVYGHPEARFL